MVDFTSELTAIMTAMVKEAFIMLLAYRRHGTRLMPSQLYHDEQAICLCCPTLLIRSHRVKGTHRNLTTHPGGAMHTVWSWSTCLGAPSSHI